MAVHSGVLRLQTEGHCQVVDLTGGVRSIVEACEAQVGVVSVFATGSTVAVTTMEYEPGTVVDLQRLLERLIPVSHGSEAGSEIYAHNQMNGDSNGYAHLRAALIGPSESIPVVAGELVLGTWQQIVLLDFDDRPRTRTVAVHVVS